MFMRENPVLQRELLVNLRMNRAFVLLFCYLALLGLVVYAAWPVETRVDMTKTAAAKELVDLFFLGQYLLASLMAPSFAAGAITGEKERKSYEMLLASPLKPSAILFGKLLASLAPLGILILCSLPIVMLCVPLGGVSLYEVLAAYLALGVSVVTFGMISLACSSYFSRTMAALTVSYLIILPLAITGAAFWQGLANQGFARLFLSITILPAMAAVAFLILFISTARRLLHPPDVGSEGKDVVDVDQEMKHAVGMVIQSDQFPDMLFAPAKRNDLMPDGMNPVYDKEMRSELFSQGTLMLRIVIQVSMFLAIPLMAFYFYIFPGQAAWYISYVLLFNMLVGPVFSADRITSERERDTLDLLLTTVISPWRILWGKLFSGLRVSTVLTMFVAWPVLLACLLVSQYWTNLPTMGAYLVIMVTSCVTTATVALFCSVIFRKTSISLVTSYLIILVMFMAPPAVNYFVNQFVTSERAIRAAAALTPTMTDEALENNASGVDGADVEQLIARQQAAEAAERLQAARERAALINERVRLSMFTSPFAAAHSLPLVIDPEERSEPASGQSVLAKKDFRLFGLYMLFSLVFNGLLLGGIIWMFNVRYRVTH